ncbi:MAG TPA: DNA-3-methyladenine glycosylase [Acidimicrobiales bacterium]|nr:DNA-3-methyladenine glycosylase [Acidimicrobiales bacterium]
MKPVPRPFYRRDPRDVAPELLNKLLVHEDRAGRIVEVEAYVGSIDPGSHAFRGMTPRNSTMFGPPGLFYVYFTYGMHWCSNAVCGDEGVGLAVLLRALAPVSGLEEMRAARGPVGSARDRDLCSGPAKLTQALGIDGLFDGADLVAGDRGVVIADDGTPPPTSPGNSMRIGLTDGAEHPWRWYVEGDPNVSRGVPGKRPSKKPRPPQG